jgi:hypothetical protein
MKPRDHQRIPVRLLGPVLLVAVAAALVGCKRDKPVDPNNPPMQAAAPAPKPTREHAMARLMEVPELKAWSEQIEKASHGKAHGAVIEDDPQPRIIDGKPYWQFSFVENRASEVHRRGSFLVSQADEEVLVEDVETDKLLSLPEWRRTIRLVHAK